MTNNDNLNSILTHLPGTRVAAPYHPIGLHSKQPEEGYTEPTGTRQVMQDLVFPDIHCTTLDAIQSSAGASSKKDHVI